MRKFALALCVSVFLSQLFTCCDAPRGVNTEKKVYYKIYSQNDSLIGYSLRKYVYDKDTIHEKYLSINLEGKKLIDFKRDFLKKGNNIFIFSNIKNDKNKYLYFSPSKKDTCFYINRKIENFYLCSKGRINFKNYKNVYKVLYDERGYDSRKEALILDKDYTLLARFEECYNYRKEIIIDSKEINENTKTMLEKATKQILWW